MSRMNIRWDEAIVMGFLVLLYNLLLEGLMVFAGTHTLFTEMGGILYPMIRILLASFFALLTAEELVFDRNIWKDGQYLYLTGYFTLWAALLNGLVATFLFGGKTTPLVIQVNSIVLDSFVAGLIVAVSLISTHYSQMKWEMWMGEVQIINYSMFIPILVLIIGKLTGITLLNWVAGGLAALIIGILVIDFAIGGRILDSNLLG